MSTLRFIATYWLIGALVLFGWWALFESVGMAAASAAFFYVTIVPVCWLIDRVMR